MISDHLRMAMRMLNRQKTFTLFNVVGLAIGIAAFVLLSLYADYELSYDQFHQHSADLYRLRHDSYRGHVLEGSSAIPIMAPLRRSTAKFPRFKISSVSIVPMA
jgi:putative ABC transport system permease protein